MRYLTWVFVILTPLWAHAAPLAVHTDFPGGSVKILKIDDALRSVTFSAGGTPTRGWVCWWYFRVSGVEPGETLVFNLVGSGFASPDQASISTDGVRWQHTAPGKRDKGQIVFRVTVPGKEVWLAWGAPFTSSEAKKTLDAAAKNCKSAEVFELCKSKKGRSVWALKIDESKDAEKPTIWVHARQHAWEAGSSWVCKGFIDWLVSDDPRAVALRKSAIIIVVPIMDVDNVEDGEGGKNQMPHDHNRDWSEAPVHPEVQAAMLHLRRARRVSLFIDLHNPGPSDRQPFFFTPAAELLTDQGRRRLTHFLDSARLEIKGPLKLQPQPRETGKQYDPNWAKISGNWAVKNLPTGVVAACLETSWNTKESTPENYEQIGRELGQAIERFNREE